MNALFKTKRFFMTATQLSLLELSAAQRYEASPSPLWEIKAAATLTKTTDAVAGIPLTHSPAVDQTPLSSQRVAVIPVTTGPDTDSPLVKELTGMEKWKALLLDN